MSNVINLDEYRSKKERQKLKEDAKDLLAILDSFMLKRTEPLFFSISDSDGSTRAYSFDDLYGLSDSNSYEK